MDEKVQSFEYLKVPAILIFIFPNLSADIVISALAGSTVFFMTADEYSGLQKLILTFVSFFIGLIASEEATQYINIIAPIQISYSVGALITSAFAVNVMLLIRHKLKRYKRNQDPKHFGNSNDDE
ncbi:putative holin [Thorsellia anophelis]|uniref:Phage holin n=1 Tax=Thorsellia anophelis DSM 18579 TaxID=1123402 RepID=A0A1I0CBX0_9GAMM|nr:putative holin [Thorsellia anophelis]SET17017.1 Putative phage holin [Thorsellia anophelis DSM 18579]